MPHNTFSQFSDLLSNNFDASTQSKGNHYFFKGHVVKIDIQSINQNEMHIFADVTGSRSQTYSTRIVIHWQKEDVEGFCSCSVSYNCKHVVASLLLADFKHKQASFIQRLSQSPQPSQPSQYSQPPQTGSTATKVATPGFIPEITLDVKELNVPIAIAKQFPHLESLVPNWSPSNTIIAVTIPTADIHFNYGVSLVPLCLHPNNHEVFYTDDNLHYSFSRDIEKERFFLLKLFQHITVIENRYDLDKINHEAIVSPYTSIITSLQNEEDFMQFSIADKPALEANGWKVTTLHDSFSHILHDDDIDWYSDLEERSEYEYFNFNMGIIIDNQKINILPLIASMMKTLEVETLSTLSEKERIAIPLPDGTVLSTTYLRIKPIINILLELYDSELASENSLKLSKRQASLLYEIESAFQATKLRWFGGKKLRALGKKLSQFESLQSVTPPKTFKAILRNYQKEGVNWLQFLREYDLGGILADDMGLGKTVQTLAHLSIEKNKGRLKKPCLIIAPTSLMFNWKREANKFTPNLKVLIHHGEYRHTNIDDLNEYDLVLTTYPLIIRDKKSLLAYNFYYLILDEAQFIKNSKAKSTQIVQQLKAEHRLCLTGTPMENHLGELWSLFNFIMPGFLGENKQFKQVFRNPIERYSDTEKQRSLSLRVQPFMLRRKKYDVLQDLPEKTEILHTVELEGAQRDLYESIRLSMEKKVKDAIQEKGLSRSHIVILDALLKLRQVCCDPRLLSLPSARNIQGPSAKMSLLLEMLPNLIDEGRRILLFSQFTKMLSLIEQELAPLKIPYVKLTGSTKDRLKPIDAFQNKQVPLFLISLKAGGTGLNLTEADTVIHYDPWWNPAVENQATDRAHRYGQKKSVFVYKLQASGTVEETIQEMQKKKSSLMEGLFSEKPNGSLAFSFSELQGLFRGI